MVRGIKLGYSCVKGLSIVVRTPTGGDLPHGQATAWDMHSVHTLSVNDVTYTVGMEGDFPDIDHGTVRRHVKGVIERIRFDKQTNAVYAVVKRAEPKVFVPDAKRVFTQTHNIVTLKEPNYNN